MTFSPIEKSREFFQPGFRAKVFVTAHERNGRARQHLRLYRRYFYQSVPIANDASFVSCTRSGANDATGCIFLYRVHTILKRVFRNETAIRGFNDNDTGRHTVRLYIDYDVRLLCGTRKSLRRQSVFFLLSFVRHETQNVRSSGRSFSRPSGAAAG